MLMVSRFKQEIYEKSLRVRSAIPHPRIQGVIRECGGKMYMSESACTMPFESVR